MIHEGESPKCEICKKEGCGNSFFVISRYLRKIPTFYCKTCGKEITIELDPTVDKYTINKTCPCKDFVITREVLEDAKGKWEKVNYFFCEECFMTSYPSVLFIILGEDNE